MQKRRAHKKSRRGCINCKKWHTKCDEQGPPCNNCALRNAKCEYPWAAAAAVNQAMPQQQLLHREGTSSGSSPDDRSLLCNGEQAAGLSSQQLWPSSRLLELELLHLWSTNKSLCSIPEDFHYMQVILPREALMYDWLLNGILVMAALHMATLVGKEEGKRYFHVAMELYDKASCSFRPQLANINHTNHHILYIFSSMTAFINVAFLQYAFDEGDEQNLLSGLAVTLDLLNGSVSIAKTDFERLLDSPIPIRAYLSQGNASMDILGSDTRAALARLAAFNDRYHAPMHETSVDTDAGSTTTTKPYSGLIIFLGRCFAEDARGVLRGYCCVLPGAAGHEFAIAFKNFDPMALLIIMHWAVLLDRLDEEYWWARKLGKRLAMGISDVLQRSHPVLVLEWWGNISWVRRQMGLPDCLV
ncbi:Uu.00g125720.m01.CDS01 [Anthostomella pinea]|uniref:Uu.00g125720.m01.CDS01 n=1 Tax=Anthostomella pinea TaxID=933095 RepID=A0AAI8VHV3_9PEZI|nr:Uu.00g125720.m01.CDS01 [Anthostomella pinea]